MKRVEVLKPLSHDHHHGLQMVARIRRGLRGEEDPASLAASVPAFWAEHLVPHFAEEEALVVPLLQRSAAPLAERMRREHEALRALAEAVAEARATPEQARKRRADAEVRAPPESTGRSGQARPRRRGALLARAGQGVFRLQTVPAPPRCFQVPAGCDSGCAGPGREAGARESRLSLRRHSNATPRRRKARACSASASDHPSWSLGCR